MNSSSPNLRSNYSSSNELNTHFFSLLILCLPHSLLRLSAKNNGAQLARGRLADPAPFRTISAAIVYLWLLNANNAFVECVIHARVLDVNEILAFDGGHVVVHRWMGRVGFTVVESGGRDGNFGVL